MGHIPVELIAGIQLIIRQPDWLVHGLLIWLAPLLNARRRKNTFLYFTTSRTRLQWRLVKFHENLCILSNETKPWAFKRTPAVFLLQTGMAAADSLDRADHHGQSLSPAVRTAQFRGKAFSLTKVRSWCGQAD